ELGFIAFLQKDYAEAKKILEPLSLTGSTGNARATRILFGIARDTEDAAYGLARATAAASSDAGSAEWQAALAAVRLGSGHKTRADEILSKLAASSDVEKVLAAADVYARLKDYGNAARVARDAVRRFPDSAEALFRLGSSLERGGQIPESEKTFQKLLTLRPNDAPTLNY